MAEQDRRVHERSTCDASWTDVSIVNELSKEGPNAHPNIIKVKIDNISISGACVLSEEPFELDQLVRFHDDLIQKTGRVVWTCQSKIECKAGIKFENVGS